MGKAAHCKYCTAKEWCTHASRESLRSALLASHREGVVYARVPRKPAQTNESFAQHDNNGSPTEGMGRCRSSQKARHRKEAQPKEWGNVVVTKKLQEPQGATQKEKRKPNRKNGAMSL